jgi:AcrR family transcriptional regulator
MTLSGRPRTDGGPGESTRRNLIAAVERLLAERDDLDVSLRDITNAAGANIAAVNYHFGSKDALVHAVIEEALRRHADAVLAALEAVAASRGGVDDLVRAWLSPRVEHAGGRRPLLPRITALVVSGGSPALRDMGLRTHADSDARFVELLADRLPEVPRDELRFRIALAGFALSGLIVGVVDTAAIDHSSAARRSETVEKTVRFIASGLSAQPVTRARTRSRVRAR